MSAEATRPTAPGDRRAGSGVAASSSREASARTGAAQLPADGGKPALLHNMSVPPRNQIVHTSRVTPVLGRRIAYSLVLPGGSVASRDPVNGAGRSVAATGAAEAAEAPILPGRLLALLDGEVWPKDDDSAAAADELRRRINQRAAELPLPPAAAVCDRPWRDDPCVTDLLDVLTVLAKSSASVYLRDREPNLAAICDGRRVVVIVPPNWRTS